MPSADEGGHSRYHDVSLCGGDPVYVSSLRTSVVSRKDSGSKSCRLMTELLLVRTMVLTGRGTLRAPGGFSVSELTRREIDSVGNSVMQMPIVDANDISYLGEERIH